MLERGRKGEREGEKHQCVVASHVPLVGDLACNPGMCPDWESNWRRLVCRPVFNPLSHTSQGYKSKFSIISLLISMLKKPHRICRQKTYI